MEDGFILLQRKILEWGWYKDANTFRVFIHLLLKSNHKDGYFNGIFVKRGQRYTSINSLSEELKLTEKQVRLTLIKLVKTKEIEQKGTNKGTMITICNYDTYQANEKTKGQTKGKQRANKGQTKGNKQQCNNVNNVIKEELSNDNSIYLTKFQKYEKWLKQNCPGVSKLEIQMTEENFNVLTSKYDSQLITDKLLAMENKKDLTKKYKSVYLTLNGWLKK
jgi:hypothetical protein